MVPAERRANRAAAPASRVRWELTMSSASSKLAKLIALARRWVLAVSVIVGGIDVVSVFSQQNQELLRCVQTHTHPHTPHAH